MRFPWPALHSGGTRATKYGPYVVPVPRRAFIPAREWQDPRQRRGLQGERAAIGFLTACGWDIEAHRFRVGRHDLDLVIRRGRLVGFVEVKTRAGSGYGFGREAIGWRKRRTLNQLAAVWRERHGRPGDVYRFDVVEVLISRGSVEVLHIPDAWRG